MRIGGLYVLYTAFMRYFNLFKALRPKPIVRIHSGVRAVIVHGNNIALIGPVKDGY